MSEQDKINEMLAALSPQDLRQLGHGDVAYLKRYVTRGEISFVLHGADGAAIAVQKDAAAARKAAQHKGLGIVSVH